MKLFYLLSATVFLGLAAPAVAQDMSAEGLIAQFDKDSDKTLNKDEWATTGWPVPFPEEGDANKDGKIDAAEMNVLIAQFMGGGGAPPPAQQAPAAPAASPAPAPQ